MSHHHALRELRSAVDALGVADQRQTEGVSVAIAALAVIAYSDSSEGRAARIGLRGLAVAGFAEAVLDALNEAERTMPDELREAKSADRATWPTELRRPA